MKFLDRFESHTYAGLRFATGFLFLFYGSKKLFDWPVSAGGEMPFHIQYVAGPIELFGGILVMLGLFTRPTAFICSGMSAVAFFIAHIPHGIWPIANGGSLIALFAWAFLYIAAKGPGIWSLDGMLFKPKG